MFQISDQAKKIIKAVIPFVIMFAALFGYHVTVVQPQINEAGAQARGLFFPSEFKDVRITGDAIVEDTLQVDGASTFAAVTVSSIVNSGAQTAASLSATGNISGSSLNIGAQHVIDSVALTTTRIFATGNISGASLNIGANQIAAFSTFSATVTNGAWVQHNLGGTPKVICNGLQFGTIYSDSIRVGQINVTSFTVQLIDPGSLGASPNTVVVNCVAAR